MKRKPGWGTADVEGSEKCAAASTKKENSKKLIMLEWAGDGASVWKCLIKLLTYAQQPKQVRGEHINFHG